MAETNMKSSPAELARQFGPQLYQRAAEKGLTLTAYLNRYENTDPNDKSGLDVFDRVLREAGIVSNGVPEMGIWPSEYGDFDRSPQMRAMSAEWMLRQWRKVSLNSGKRNLFMNSDAAAGDWARPYADAQMARWDQQVAPAIPLSAVVANRDILGVLNPGEHGSTFGGNALAMAIGTEVVEILRRGEFQDRSAHLGERLHARLRSLIGQGVVDVRGMGLWAGVDIDERLGTGKELSRALARRGVLVKDTHGSTLRFAPPLVITADEIDWAVGQLEYVLGEEQN